MTVNIGDNLGPAGTRVTKRLGPDDEIWTYVWQAIVGATALDLVLTCLLVICMIVGWWSLSIFLGIVGFLVAFVVLAYGRPRAMFWRFLFGNLWTAAAIAGLIVGQKWYAMIRVGSFLLWSQLSVVGSFEWYVYALAGIVLVAIWIRFDWRAMVACALIAVIVCIGAMSDPDEWTQAWHNLKHLIIPYLWPVIAFSILLAIVMVKEILLPNLEWTLQPVTLEELREIGLFGLYCPGLFSRSVEDEPEPQPEMPVVRAEHREDTENGVRERYGLLPFSDRARDFYKAVYSGKPFTLSTARQLSVGRRTFEKKIWPVFRDRGWAQWRDDQHHDQGRQLTRAGWEMIEELVKSDPRH